jgi:hypothetical protein
VKGKRQSSQAIQEPVRKGRVVFRKNLAFHGQSRGRLYAVKKVAPVVAEEADRFGS